MEEIIPSWVFQIIYASIGATISGVILLHTHHTRVKQEIELHKRKDEFNRKQTIYRYIIDDVNERVDFMFYFGNDMNWRKGKQLYGELILIGSKSVINAYNDFITNYNLADPKDDVKIKKILVEIRKDLYGDKFDTKDIKMFNPGKRMMDVLKIMGKNKTIFEQNGFRNIQSFVDMDIEKTVELTKMSKEELEEIKELAISEKIKIEKLKEFKNNL